MEKITEEVAEAPELFTYSLHIRLTFLEQELQQNQALSSPWNVTEYQK